MIGRSRWERRAAILTIVLAAGCSTATAEDAAPDTLPEVPVETRVLADISVPQPPSVEPLHPDPAEFGVAEFESWWAAVSEPLLEMMTLLDQVALAMPLPGEGDRLRYGVDIGAVCEATVPVYVRTIDAAFPAPTPEGRIVLERGLGQIGDGLRMCVTETSTDLFDIGAALVPDYLEGRFQTRAGIQGMGEAAGIGSTFELPAPGSDGGIEADDPADTP